MHVIFAVGLFVVVTAAQAQAPPIWRCSDGQGGVLYSDQRCAGGVVLDIPESRPDPGAWERLRRGQESFEARQAAREATERADEERRRREADARRPRDAAPAASYGPSYPWFYAPMYQPPLPRKPPVRRPPPSLSFVPAR